MTKSEIEYDDLPLELKIKIFEFLEIDDLLTLRLVCKNWNSIMCQVKIKELVFDCANSTEKQYYHHSNIAKRNLIKIDNQMMIKRVMESSIFNLKHLNRLWINLLTDEFDIELINKLGSKLIQLEIVRCNGCNGKLNLKNLEILCFNTIYNSNLIIDSPKLQMISCKIGIDQIEFNQPDSVKRLQIYSFKEKVFSFVNLEYLILDHTDQSDFHNVSEMNFLERLSKLKEINFHLQDYDNEYFMYTMETIRYLLNDKKKLNKRPMKIHFKDRLIVDEEQLDLMSPSDFFADFDSDQTNSDNESIDSSEFIFDYEDELYESDNSLMDEFY